MGHIFAQYSQTIKFIQKHKCPDQSQPFDSKFTEIADSVIKFLHFEKYAEKSRRIIQCEYLLSIHTRQQKHTKLNVF